MNVNTDKNSPNSEVSEEVRSILRSILQLGEAADLLDAQSGLLGVIPEMDSMAVVSIITGLEERFGFEVMDDDISAASFETFGALIEFVSGKVETA